MPRGLASIVATASASDPVYAAYAAELDFASGPVRMSQAPLDITIGGNTFMGAGDLADVSSVSEKTVIETQTITLTLSLLDSTILTAVTSDDYQQRNAYIWLVFFDDNMQQQGEVSLGPWLMDKVKLTAGKNNSIALPCISPLGKLQRPNTRFYTDQDHQSRHPGDDFFKLRNAHVGQVLLWGRK